MDPLLCLWSASISSTVPFGETCPFCLDVMQRSHQIQEITGNNFTSSAPEYEDNIVVCANRPDLHPTHFGHRKCHEAYIVEHGFCCAFTGSCPEHAMGATRLIGAYEDASPDEIEIEYGSYEMPDEDVHFDARISGEHLEPAELTDAQKQVIAANLKRAKSSPDYIARLSGSLGNSEGVVSYVMNAWVFDSMKMVDRGRYSIPIYAWVGLIAGYDTWQLNRRQFDKRRQAVLDECVRRNVHGDKSWLTNFIVSVDKLDDTNIYTALGVSKPKVKVYDASMDSNVVMFQRINPLASKATVGAILNKFKGLKENKQQQYEKKLALHVDAEGENVKQMSALMKMDQALERKKKEFENAEAVFKKRREDLVNIPNEAQRLAERRRIEKDEERVQYEEERISIERKSIFQRIQEIKPMPEFYHKPSKIINAVRDLARPVALKLNKMGPDWRDIMTLIGKVPVDKFLNLTYIRKKLFKMVSQVLPIAKGSALYNFTNSLLSHVWFILEPIVELLEWVMRSALQLLRSINESKLATRISMYYGDWVNLYMSVFHNIYGVIPEFFIILYSNFFQLWYHLYLWGNKTLFKNISRIL